MILLASIVEGSQPSGILCVQPGSTADEMFGNVNSIKVSSCMKECPLVWIRLIDVFSICESMLDTVDISSDNILHHLTLLGKGGPIHVEPTPFRGRGATTDS